MKKALALVLALVMMACVCMACAKKTNDEPKDAEGGYKIAYTSNYLGNSWRTQYEEAIRTRFDQYKEKGVVSDYTFVACNSDVTEQLNQLNALLQEDYDLIMIDAVSASSLTSVIEEANEKGVKILLGNTICPYEGVTCISADLASVYAKADAYYLCDKLDGKGDIVEMFGVAGQGTCELFELAAQEVFDQYDINILAKTNGYWNDADAQTEMATLLSTYGESIDGIFCEDGMTYGIINAYLNAGEATVPVGGDYFNSFIQYWYNNQDTLDTIMIPNSPYATGTALVDCCVYMCAGYEVQADQFIANPLDTTVNNWCALAMPYIVLEKDEMNASWLSNFPNTAVMSLDDAHALMDGKEETAAIPLYFDDDYIAGLFGLEKSLWW